MSHYPLDGWVVVTHLSHYPLRYGVVGQFGTSHVERQNLTIRMQVRRLTRLTNAFSKKVENLKAAMDLHFTHYNFVHFHRSIRCTPAMEAGVVSSPMTVKELIEMAA